MTTLHDPVVPMHHPRLLVETAIAQGATQHALLRNVGILPTVLSSPDARISYLQFGQLALNALQLTGNPALGLDVGSRATVASMGMVGLAVMSSPDARAALETGLRYYRILAPGWDLSMQVVKDRAVLHASSNVPLGPLEVFASEVLVAAFWNQGRTLMGARMPTLEVRLPYAAPAHAERYAAFAGLSVTFGCERLELSWAAEGLNLPLPSADPLTASVAERHCAMQLTPTLPTEKILDEIERLLHAAPGEFADLNQVAEKLRIDVYELRRHLQRLGTSYQKLVDDVRRQQALRCMTATQMTSEQVSERLGFGDVRSFRRAFKRWTGITPTACRQTTHGVLRSA